MSEMVGLLKQQIKSLHDRIAEIQNLCSHPKPCVKSVPHAIEDDIGNTTGYFTNHYCGLCEKSWDAE